MKCFYCPYTERKEREPRKPTFSWLRSFSSDSNCEGRKSGSEVRSQAASQIIVEPTGDPYYGSSGPSLSQRSSQRPRSLRIFSYPELRTATRNFYRGNLLGEGGFGSVYKGYIRHTQQNGVEAKMDVAVKQMNRKGHQGHKEWLAEVHFLGLVEHPNLVKLIGYCAEDDERGIQRLLVYEFMPNKSLEENLFRRGPPPLPWNKRLDIALGAARGLAYLHEEIADFQVIFRDFKTSNVLLDDGFNPKLSDFGLARQGPEPGITHISTAIVGTMGYAAPEYLQTGHLTAKSDVWSFGVVLLEILSGRRSIDRNRPKNEQRLLDWVKPYLQGSKKFHIIMDPRLDGQYSLVEAQKVGLLAQQCLVKYPRARPKMSDVVEKLKQIIDMSDSGSPNSAISSLSATSETMDVPNKDPTKKSSAKRRAMLSRRVGNLSSNNDAKAMRWSWVPRLEA